MSFVVMIGDVQGTMNHDSRINDVTKFFKLCIAQTKNKLQYA